MAGVIKAIYEGGVLRPLSEVRLSEHEEVEIIILQEGDDLPAWAILGLAQVSESFSFLSSPEEDIYSRQDGEPV